MPLTLIRNDQFTTVLGALTDPNTVYVIPTFQRPYAWSEKQIKDLLSDMTKASNQPNGHHYLSALHLIPIAPNNPQDKLTDFIDYEGIAHLSELRDAEKKKSLKTPQRNAVKVYAVVDGQQRLTTLFLLTHLYFSSQNNPNLRSSLYVELINGPIIPRLIQNPADDHSFMVNLVDNLWGLGQPPNPNTRSQERMKDNLEQMRIWARINAGPLAFLEDESFKTSAIELEAGYGLTSFMTLNDRGKPLTVLEKLKALLLQFAYDANAHALITDLHAAFGDLYLVLDKCIYSKLFQENTGDDEMVKLLSCYLRLSKDRKAIWQGADAAYEEFFRQTLGNLNLANVPGKIGEWCLGINQVREQLEHLNQYINGGLGGNFASIHFPTTPATLADDYQVTVKSLGLQLHLLALLLKFRAFCGAEWHQRFPIQAHAFPLKPIRDLLSDVRQRANNAGTAVSPLLAYIDAMLADDPQPKTEICMLEIIERIQIFDWNLESRRHQTFVDFCVAAFNHQQPQDFISVWMGWHSPVDFIDNTLRSYKDTNCKFLLKEYERSFGNNLHFQVMPQISTNGIELEHIFAQSIDANRFPDFGIIDRTDFDQNVLWRSGNLTWLSKSCNDSLRNASPEIKGPHYNGLGCNGHPAGSGNNVASDIAITEKLGNELVALGVTYPSMRYHIEARCAELALFAVRRFC